MSITREVPASARAVTEDERTWHFDGELPTGNPDNYVVRAFRETVRKDANGKVVYSKQDVSDPIVMRYGVVKDDTAPLPGGKTLPLPALMFAIAGYFDQKAEQRAAERAAAQAQGGEQ